MSTLLQQLEQLAPLAAAATEGPWAYQPEYDDALVFFDEDGTGVCPNPYRPICRMDDLDDDWAEQNAIFIAAARNLLTPENLALLIAQQAAQWVSVAERLPYYGEVALVAAAHPLDGFSVLQRTFRFMGEEGWQRHTTAGGNSDKTITHWMPLPQPPAAPADAPR